MSYGRQLAGFPCKFVVLSGRKHPRTGKHQLDALCNGGKNWINSRKNARFTEAQTNDRKPDGLDVGTDFHL